MFHHEGIDLRPIERRDLEFLRLMHNDWTTLENLTDTSMVSELQQEDWFESVSRSKTSLRLLVENEGDPIGCIRLDHIDHRNRSVQVGGDIASAFRGQGFGNKMFSGCLKYAFDILNMRRAYLSVLETNIIAYNMYTKHGFIEEGRQKEALYRLGRYYDYINMYLLESKYRGKQ